MSKVITSVGSFLLFVMFILAGFTIHGRTTRQIELENAMTSSLEKTMQTLETAEGISPASNEEMIGYFLQLLTMQIKSESKLTVNVIEADVEKGLLSAEGSLTYVHPIGTIGHVSCKKTIIMEQYAEETSDKKGYTIQFMANGSVFKTYKLSEGSEYINPGVPMSDTNQKFKEWAGPVGQGTFEKLLAGKPITEDAVYVAQFD